LFLESFLALNTIYFLSAENTKPLRKANLFLYTLPEEYVILQPVLTDYTVIKKLSGEDR